MKILGIDYGLKNLGFATAETPFATPHSVARVDSLDTAISASTRVIDSYHPDRIVVGIPEGPIADSVNTFVNALRPLVTIDIVTHPETLSSKEAVSKLRQIRASRDKLQGDHAFAACLILEDYLDAYPDLVKV